MKISSGKRKPSSRSPYARPREPPRRADGDLRPTGSRFPARLRTKPRLEPFDFSGVRKGATAELSTSTSEDKDSGFCTPPSLRRASTLTLAEDEPSKDAATASSDCRTPPQELFSAPVKGGSLTSSLRKLNSGSIVGQTSLAAVDNPSKDTPSMSERVLSTVSSLLKKMTLPKRVSSCSQDGLDSETRHVDENNLTTALEELKQQVSKTHSHSSRTPSVKSINSAECASVSPRSSFARRSTKEKQLSGAIYVVEKLKAAASRGKSAESEANSDTLSEESTKLSSKRRKSSIRSTGTAHVGDLSDDPSRDPTDVEMDDDTGDATAGGTTLLPAGLVEVAISFDTTGSMYHCLDEVKAKIQDLVQRLQADIPGIRFAVIAHGDYCDTDKYVIKWLDFGASLPELCDFVKGVEDTYGGDGPECYELVLLRAREALSWTPGSRRVLIVINDDVPHGPVYKYKGDVYRINWREECAKLRDMGVVVYGVQAGTDKGSRKFNDEMARLTGGRHLMLTQFSSILHLIMMICYREGNPLMLPMYEQEVRRSSDISKDVEAVARTFGVDDTAATSARGSASKKTPRGGRSRTAASPVASKTVTAATTARHGSSKASRSSLKTETRVAGKDPTSTKRGLSKAKSRSAEATIKLTAKSKLSRKKLLKRDKVLKRELLSDSHLTKGALKHLKWTPWTTAIVPELPKTKLKSKFVKCTNYPGFRLKQIFNGDSRKPAIYEFAVQGPGSAVRKKNVVYFRKSVGYNTVRFWDLYQFRHQSIQKEVERAVSRGCSIWIRRAVLKGSRSSSSEEKQIMKAGLHIKTTIDYAWKKYLWRKRFDGRLFHRIVTIRKQGGGGFPIAWGDL